LPFEVFVFVRRGGEVLVLHRSERQGSYWHSVAGGLEPGESWAEAAARELQEETGLVAEPVELDGQWAYPVGVYAAEYEPGTEQVDVHSFVVEAPPEWEPRLDWEHDDYRWCTVDDACELFYWPEPRAALRALA
jgi:lipoyl(octanoyl) transferase